MSELNVEQFRPRKKDCTDLIGAWLHGAASILVQAIEDEDWTLAMAACWKMQDYFENGPTPQLVISLAVQSGVEMDSEKMDGWLDDSLHRFYTQLDPCLPENFRTMLSEMEKAEKTQKG